MLSSAYVRCPGFSLRQFCEEDCLPGATLAEGGHSLQLRGGIFRIPQRSRCARTRFFVLDPGTLTSGKDCPEITCEKCPELVAEQEAGCRSNCK